MGSVSSMSMENRAAADVGVKNSGSNTEPSVDNPEGDTFEEFPSTEVGSNKNGYLNIPIWPLSWEDEDLTEDFSAELKEVRTSKIMVEIEDEIPKNKMRKHVKMKQTRKRSRKSKKRKKSQKKQTH